MYRIQRTSHFIRKSKKLSKVDRLNQKAISDTIHLVAINPFDHKLKTHKVKNSQFGLVWSSRVTGDLRILWEFRDEIIVLLLTIGGHSGKRSVYT